MIIKKLDELKERLAAYSSDAEKYADDARAIINLAKEIKNSESLISSTIAVAFADILAIVDVLVKY